VHVVFFTSAFPGTAGNGIDMVLARRARALTGRSPVVAVAPVPWVPRSLGRASPRWARYRAAARRGHLERVPVLRPRYLQVPGIGPWAAVAMALGALGCVRALRRRGRCDVLFAQALLPDGLAAVLLGRWTATPVACLGRGTDVHGLGPAGSVARRLAAFTVRHAAAVGVVAHELAAMVQALGHGSAPAVLHDGIDLERFSPGDRAVARALLGRATEERLVLYVGRLARGKGLTTLIEALARLGDTTRLALVGSGALAPGLATLARRLRVDDRVHFAGEAPHGQIATWMRAADVLALPSEAEGFPNVVREALACGLPVVGTPVGDLPRVVTPAVGRLVPIGDARALAEALASVLDAAWDRAAIRTTVAGMTWERNAEATARFLAAAVAAA